MRNRFFQKNEVPGHSNKRYQNLSEEEKQKLVGYKRNYYVSLKKELQGHSTRFLFLAIRVDGIAVILAQLGAFEKTCFEFLY